MDDLLAQWQTNRSSRIADALQAVPADGELAKRLDAFARAKWDASTKVVTSLPDDPRVTVALVAALRAAKWPGSGAKPLWLALLKKLVELRDRRAIEPLRACAKTPPYFEGASFTTMIVAKIAATAEALERVKAESHEPSPWFAAPKVAASVDTIIADVFAHPDDHGVRSVAADVFIEQSDPWGELIMLQLGDKEPKRVDELLKKLAARISGPIGHVAKREGMVFEAGFLAEVALDKAMVGRRRWEDAAKTPYWSTVRAVRMTGEMPSWFPKTWLANPAIAALREIKIYREITIARTDANAPWKITRASGYPNFVSTKCFKAFIAGLPKLELARMALPRSPACTEIMRKAGHSAS